MQDLEAPKPAVLVRFRIAKFELSLGGLVPADAAAAPSLSAEAASRLPERHPPTARMMLRVEHVHLSAQEDWLPPPRNNEVLLQFDVSWLDMISFPADPRQSPRVRTQRVSTVVVGIERC